MTNISGDIVGCISGEQMGEGPDKGGREDLAEVTGDLEEMVERPAMDSESGTCLAMLTVDKLE